MTPCQHPGREDHWHTWHLVGVQHMPAIARIPAYSFDLRDCPHCGSTLADRRITLHLPTGAELASWDRLDAMEDEQ